MSATERPQIGLFGGSFNPVHLGHLVVAGDALDLFGLDEVWFLPLGRPPHKPGPALAPAPHRRAMLEAALAPHPRFRLCAHEIDREDTSFTLHTLQALTSAHRDLQFRFIIGGDSLRDLHLWFRIGDLLPLADFAPIARPGVAAPAADLGLPGDWGLRLSREERTGHLCDISASEVRERIRAGRPFRHLVPAPVADYIEAHPDLYRTETASSTPTP